MVMRIKCIRYWNLMSFPPLGGPTEALVSLGAGEVEERDHNLASDHKNSSTLRAFNLGPAREA